MPSGRTGNCGLLETVSMITCYLQYEIVPEKMPAFEEYAQAWMRLVEEFGGEHHGYFVAYESASDIAVALFSFASLADYENYRRESAQHPECIELYAVAEKAGCIRRYDRQFLRPLTPTDRKN